MQALRAQALKKLEWLPLTQAGGDQDALHQTVSERVMLRTLERQVNELHIRAAILYRFTELGWLQTVDVASARLGDEESLA